MFGQCRFSARRKKPGQDNQAESEKRQVADPSSSTAMTRGDITTATVTPSARAILSACMSARSVMRCVALLLLLCGVAAFADDFLDAALKRLSTLRTFAFGGIGYASETSKGGNRFQIRSFLSAAGGTDRVLRNYMRPVARKENPTRFQASRS